MDKDLAVSSMRTIQDLAGGALRVPRFTSAIVGAFALLALILMAAGVYALISFATSLRLPEIGVRLALGAERRQVVQLVMGQALTLGIMGIALGGLCAIPLAGVLRTQLFGVTPVDPLTWVAVTVVVIVAVLGGVLVAGSARVTGRPRDRAQTRRVATTYFCFGALNDRSTVSFTSVDTG